MHYRDTSAFLKLVVAEDHSVELREAMTGVELWSSVLLDVEGHCAARLLGVSADAISQALEAVALITLGDDAVRNARSIGDDGQRTLDTLHLATALELGDDLEAVVTLTAVLRRPLPTKASPWNHRDCPRTGGSTPLPEQPGSTTNGSSAAVPGRCALG